MSTLVLEHLKHTNASSNNITLAADGSLALGNVTGDTTFDTNTLKIDATNNRVGVGTASPSSALHVSGGAGTNVAIQSSSGHHWRIGDGVGSSNGNLVIYDYTDSRKCFEITSSGAILAPTTPIFSVKDASGSYTVGSAARLEFDTIILDTSSGWSTANNRYTIPQAGNYLFTWFSIHAGQVTNEWMSLRRNGARMFDQHYSTSNGNWHHSGASAILNCAQNDYIELYNGGNSINYHGQTWSNLSGFLLS